MVEFTYCYCDPRKLAAVQASSSWGTLIMALWKALLDEHTMPPPLPSIESCRLMSPMHTWGISSLAVTVHLE